MNLGNEKSKQITLQKTHFHNDVGNTVYTARFLNKNLNTRHYGAHLITTEQTSAPTTHHPHIYTRAKYSSTSSTDGSTNIHESRNFLPYPPQI
jgi:hypothetical protein